MSFEKILGQESAITEIEKVVASNRLAHAYLFEGPPGVGKFTTAMELAHRLLCHEKSPHESCRVRRTIENGTNLCVAVIRLEPERRTISIDEIRDSVIPALWRKSNNGEFKVVVIDQAEYLGVEAQNALLKTLEEPPPDSVIVLVCASKDALLPTVISRCQIVRFKPLSPEIIARISPGSAADAGFEKARKLLFDSVVSVLRGEIDPLECAEGLVSAVRAYAGSVQQKVRNELSTLFDSLLSNLGDTLMRRPNNAHQAQSGGESFAAFPDETLERICRIALQTKTHIFRNVNISLALEEFFLKLYSLRVTRRTAGG
jgi:DNA polymerase-3 subunit delta'